MKYLGKFWTILLASAAVLAVCMATVFADGEQPRVILKESGIQNQYVLRLENFSSKFESVQFDICVNGKIDAPDVQWRDNSTAHFQQVNSRQEDGKTVLTVYIDRLRPIANSNNADLAELTFRQSVPASKFSLGEEMIALDNAQDKTVFQPSLHIVASDTGSGGSSGATGGAGGAGGSEDSDRNVSNSGSTTSNRTVLNWSHVSGQTTKNAITLFVDDNEVIGREIFRRAADRADSLVLDYGDYKWTFHVGDGVSMPGTRIYYNLSVEEINYKNISAAVGNTDLAQFEIAHSGSFPCKASLSYKVGTKYAGETVYLACYNENEATLEYKGSAQVDSDGMVTFTLDEGMKYVITSKNLWEPEKAAGTGGTAVSGGNAAPGSTGTFGAAAPGSGTAGIAVPPEDQIESMQEAQEPSSDELVDGEEEPGSSDDEKEQEPVEESELSETSAEQTVENPNQGSRTRQVLVLIAIVAAAAVIGILIKVFTK